MLKVTCTILVAFVIMLSNTEKSEGVELKKKGPYSENAVTHYNSGVDYHQAGDYEAAISEYRNAVVDDPRMEDAWHNLGCLYVAKKDYLQAERSYQHALKLREKECCKENGKENSEFSHAMYQEYAALADIYIKKGEFELADSMFKKSLAVVKKSNALDYKQGMAKYASFSRERK